MSTRKGEYVILCDSPDPWYNSDKRMDVLESDKKIGYDKIILYMIVIIILCMIIRFGMNNA